MYCVKVTFPTLEAWRMPRSHFPHLKLRWNPVFLKALGSLNKTRASFKRMKGKCVIKIQSTKIDYRCIFKFCIVCCNKKKVCSVQTAIFHSIRKDWYYSKRYFSYTLLVSESGCQRGVRQGNRMKKKLDNFPAFLSQVFTVWLH